MKKLIAMLFAALAAAAFAADPAPAPAPAPAQAPAPATGTLGAGPSTVTLDKVQTVAPKQRVKKVKAHDHARMHKLM